MSLLRILVAGITSYVFVATVRADDTQLNLKVLATDDDVAIASNHDVKAVRTTRDRLSDQSFVTFAKWPNLYGVYLDNTAVTGTGFHLLDEHRHLVQVVLMGPNVGNEGALTVARLPHVTHLTIGNGIPPKYPVRNARLTDRGLRAIAKMPRLAWLVVVDADITDEGIQHLGKLKSVQSIVFDYCPGLTQHGIAQLQSQLPKTKIEIEHRPTRH